MTGDFVQKNDRKVQNRYTYLLKNVIKWKQIRANTPERSAFYIYYYKKCTDFGEGIEKYSLGVQARGWDAGKKKKLYSMEHRIVW